MTLRVPARELRATPTVERSDGACVAVRRWGDARVYGVGEAEQPPSPEVPLEQELAFVNDYLDIQRARFDGRVQVHHAIDPAVIGAFVPVLQLQSDR